MPVFVFYGLVNLTIVKVTGFIIYPGMTWNSFLSYLLAFSAVPASIALWYFLAWCTNKKTLRFLKKHIENLPVDLRSEIEPSAEVSPDEGERDTNESIDGDNLI